MIIALNGRAGSGKSTAAQYLVEQHGFTLVKFAGPLKAMMKALGLGQREIEGDLKEKPHPLLGGRTPRYAMQTLGTEWGRNIIHSDLWVMAAMERVLDVLDLGGKAVIDDCRFPNEAKAVIESGGSIIRLTREGAGITGGHSSEDQELPRNWEILNNGSIKGLHNAVEAVLWHIKEKGKCA